MSLQPGQNPNQSANPGEDVQARNRKTALQHALAIEEKKKIKGRVLDLALQAFDLPSDSAANPAKPSVRDRKLFSECLEVLSPTDLDELVDERNIDHRCGYTLCPRPNRGRAGDGRKTWNGKLGDNFAFVDKAEKEKWCSSECRNRNNFIRGQLATEPAWLREGQTNEVRLLDELDNPEHVVDSSSANRLTSESEDTTNKLPLLEAERSENSKKMGINDIEIFERATTRKTRPPQFEDHELIEGLPTRQHKARS